MAHKKGAGSSDNGRDSISKRLGVKLFGGQVAVAGNIIVRQRGTRFHPGENVYMGKDHTLHAAVDGLVRFKKGYKNRNFVFIEPVDEVLAKRDAAPKSPKAKTVAPKAPAAPVAAPAKKVAVAKPAAAATTSTEAVVTKTVVETPAVETVVKESAAAVVSETVSTSSATITSTTVTTSSSSSSTETVEFTGTPDDLKKVEGIGPKIEGLLNEAGIMTWAQLSKTSVDRIKEVLAAAGGRYASHNPGTWPYQAKLAAEGNWDELKDYQDVLDGGVSPE